MKTQTAYAFFYKHAGYSYGQNETPAQGRARGAKALAKAEREALDAEFSFEWSIDPHTDSSDFSDEKPSWALWQCSMRNANGEICDSLGGVDFGRDRDPWMDPYRRVVEAELALSGMDNVPQGKGRIHWKSDKEPKGVTK